MRKIRLGKKEKDLFKSIENGKWRPVKNTKAEINKYARYAKKSVTKDQRKRSFSINPITLTALFPQRKHGISHGFLQNVGPIP